MKKYVAFDIEVATLAPDFKDPDPDYRLGVTCVGLHVVDGKRVFDHVFYGSENQGGDLDVMTAEQCWHVATELGRAVQKGYIVVSFNGLKFDFQVLAAEIADLELNYGGVEVPSPSEQIANLALVHYDLGFHMVCEKGFMSGLDKLAQSTLGIGKSEGMDGVAAVEMWNQGREAQDQVLKYVQQDALVTGLIYEAAVELGQLKWISGKGRLCTWKLRSLAPLHVCDARELPLPTMDWAWDREDFIGWAEKRNGA